MGISTLIKIVSKFISKLLYSEALRFIEAIHSDFPSVIPPFRYGIKMF